VGKFDFNAILQQIWLNYLPLFSKAKRDYSLSSVVFGILKTSMIYSETVFVSVWRLYVLRNMKLLYP